MGSAIGAVRNGPALLTGLLRCGRCGRALQVCYTRSKHHGLLPRYWCAGDRGRQTVRSCITFAGTRVDQSVAIEVLEALRPLGVQAALDALDHSQNQTDEKRTSLQLAFQKARYEASRIERQYQAAKPENRLVATELEKRWNNALAHVAELEQRVEEASALAPHLTAEQRQQAAGSGRRPGTALGSSSFSRHVEEAYPAHRPAGSDRRHYG
jgi:Recombinase zinc beta ribbon domain